MRRTLAIGVALSLMASLLLSPALTRADDPEPVDMSYQRCRELDAIESSGSSVLQHLTDSRYSRYILAISTMCTQYLDELRTQYFQEIATDNTAAMNSPCWVDPIVSLPGLDKEEFRQKAAEVYRLCPDKLPQLAEVWQRAKAQDSGTPLAISFDILHPCDKLKRYDERDDDEQMSAWVRASGIKDFENSILQYCPDYLSVLAEALNMSQGFPDRNPASGSDPTLLDRLSEVIDEILRSSGGNFGSGSDPTLQDRLAEELDGILNSSDRSFGTDLSLTFEGLLAEAVAKSRNPSNSDFGGGLWQNNPPSADSYNPEFERKPACEKLTIIDRDPNKDLVAYIRESGVADFEAAIASTCPGYQNALNEAR